MSGLHRAALPALGAAILFGASTPFAKQLIGDGLAASSPFLLAGLLYLGSGLGLTLIRLVRDRGWKSVDLPSHEWPWLLGAIAFGGVLGPLLLMVGLSHTTAATASLFLNLESVLTAVLALVVFGEPTSLNFWLAGALMAAGVWLHITEQHAHEHEYEELLHGHRHHHDEHHQHTHDFDWDGVEPHTHVHQHQKFRHQHAHFGLLPVPWTPT